MGKTAVTTARSSSAIFSNPSILATFSEPQIQLGGKLFYGTITSEVANESDRYESFESRYQPFPNRSYLAFAVPYQLPDTQLKLVFGLGYQRNEGVKWESEALWLREEWSERSERLVNVRVTQNTSASSRGSLSTITPGISLNFQDKYFFGATVNRTLGAIISTWEQQQSGEQRKEESEREQSALFLRVGAFAEVTPELSVGLTYRPEFEWELGETITKTTSDGDLDTDRDQDRIELTMPAMWGIGVEYKVSPELIVAVEVQSRPFSELRWNTDIDQQPIIGDGFNFAAGVEYLGAAYPVRLGAFRDVIPFVDENDTDPVNLVGLTAGIGSGGDEDFSWNLSGLFGQWEQIVTDEGQEVRRESLSCQPFRNVSLWYGFQFVL